MFKKRVLPVLLSLALTATAALPVVYAVESSGEVEAEQPVPQTVNFTNAGPFLPVTLAEEQDNGLELNKYVTYDKQTGEYNITMEAYTTGEVKSGEAKPSDIILVLDLSTSMDERFSNSSYKYTPVYSLSRNETYYAGDRHVEVKWCNDCQAWTSGCLDFIWHAGGTKYYPKTSESDTTSGHVQFYEQDRVESMTRLEALKQTMSAFVSEVASKETDDRIALVYFEDEAGFLTGRQTTNDTAFYDATKNAGYLKNQIEGISKGDLDEATEHGKGLEKAVNVFDAYQDKGEYAKSDRNKVVVLVTDGEPAPMGTNNWSSRIVKQAIESAYTLKNNYEASVYTVSVAPGTNASNPTSYMDRYMDYVSSNYPQARHPSEDIDNVKEDGDSYYNTGYEGGIWGGNSVASESEKRDIMQWVIPGEKIDTTDGGYYLTASDTSALEDIFGQIADQTGGAKIDLGSDAVIHDVVTPYFTLPNANDVRVTVEDAYYDNDGNLQWRQGTSQDPDPQVSVDSQTPAVNITGFDFAKNFVAPQGRVEGDVTQEGDFHGRRVVVTFAVEADYTNFFGGNNVPTNGETSGVYENEFKVQTGENVELFEQPLANVPVRYVVPDTEETIFAGTEPNLASESIDYLPGYEPNGVNNAYVTITYTLTNRDGETVGVYEIPKGQPATAGTWTTQPDVGALYEETVYDIKCTVTPDTAVDSAVGPEEVGELLVSATHTVHIMNGTLTIHKNGGVDGERYVFKVTGANDFEMTVSVPANGETTISGLPAGTYTVEEDDSWSWRFDPQYDGGNSVKITVDNQDAVVYCTNKMDNDNWLNQYDWVANHADGGHTDGEGSVA